VRITVVNAHSSHNLGDAAIVKSTMAILRECCPDARISLVSDTPELDQGRLDADDYLGLQTPFAGAPDRLRRQLFKAYFLYIDLLGRLPRSWLARTGIWFRDNRSVYRAILGSDLVISCGGGYINSLGKLEVRLGLLHFAACAGRKTLFWPQSVSDVFGRWHESLVRRVVSESSGFIAREPATHRYLAQLGVPETLLHQAADSAFLLPFSRAWPAMPPLAERSRFGLTVTRWSFPRRPAAAALWRSYAAAVRRMVSAAIADGYTVYVFPQVTGPGAYSDDRNTANEILRGCGDPRLHVLQGAYDPEQLKGMIACMDIFVGTRMHSNIFSLGAGVPTAAIAYQSKTTGIMSELGFGELVIDIGDITEEKLLCLYRRLSSQQAVLRRELEARLPQVQRSARAAGEVCRSILWPQRATERRPERDGSRCP
jgi:colanic acid/amylovoran biosynthesis protein